jgi:hypothetical protein
LAALRPFASIRGQLRNRLRRGVAALSRSLWGLQAAQVAKYQGIAKIFKNPCFSLDPSGLYAKIVGVKIESTGRCAGGIKTGSPFVADCLLSVLSAAGPAEVEGPEDLTQRGEGMEQRGFFPPWRLCAVASLRWILQAKPKRENRVASVRVFRVFRGENASFLSLLSLLAANQWKRLSRNHLDSKVEFSRSNRVKPSQTQSNPVKPFFLL